MSESTDGVSPERPWLGLLSYTVATQAYFYGRDRQIRELYERVRLNPLTVLYGRSGLGKTSLLQAGLVPLLQVEGRRAIVVRLNIADNAPPLLEQVHAALSANLDLPSPISTLWELSHHAGTRAAIELARPVLIFDQFEEIFTLGRRQTQNDRRDELAAFIAELANLVENRVPAAVAARGETDRAYADALDLRESMLRVVLTLREDYLHELERWKKTLPSMMRNRMELLELDGPNALRAVVGPGSKHEPALVTWAVAADIVCFVAGRESGTDLTEIDAVPPMLSLLCAELNASRLDGGEATISHERVRSQSKDILKRFYERCFEGLSAARDVVERLLIDSDGRYRESSSRNNVLAKLAEQGIGDPDAALDTLIARRLLSTDVRDEVPRIELAHDLLVPLAAASRDTAKRERELERRRRIEVSKWRAVALIALLTGLITVVVLYTKSEREKARQVAEEQQHARKAMDETLQQAARRAYGRFEERLSEPFDRTRYAYLAESLSYRELPQARAAASLALQHMAPDIGERRFDRAGQRPIDARFSADGTRFLVRYDGGAAALWMVNSNKPLVVVNDSRTTTGDQVTLSRDGSLLAHNSQDDAVRVILVAAPQVPIFTLPHGESPADLAFSTDGRRLLSLAGGVARSWALDAAPPAFLRIPSETPLRSVQFDADDSAIVTLDVRGIARRWNASTGMPIGRPLALGKNTESASLGPGGRDLIAVNRDGEVAVWNVERAERRWNVQSITAVRSAGFGRAGRRVAIEYVDGRIALRMTDDGLLLDESPAISQLALDPASTTYAAHPAFSADGLLVAGITDGSPVLRSTSTGETLAGLGNRSDAKMFRFSPTGGHVLALGSGVTLLDLRPRAPLCELLRQERPALTTFDTADGDLVAIGIDTLQRWNTTTHRVVETFRADASKEVINLPTRALKPRHFALGDYIAQRNRTTSGALPLGIIATHPTFTRIASARTPHEVVIIDRSSGAVIGSPIRSERPIIALQFDRHGKHLLVTSTDLGSYDYILELWRLDAQNEAVRVHSVRTDERPLYGADANRFATMDSERNVIVWDAETAPQPLLTTTVGAVDSAVLDAQGRSIALALPDNGLVLVDLGTKSVVFKRALIRTPQFMRFNADGARLAVAFFDLVGVLDTKTGKAIGSELQHGGGITGVDFSSDDDVVATTSRNGLKLWSLRSGSRLTPVLLDGQSVVATRFTNNGRCIVASLDDGSLRLCDTHVDIKATSTQFAEALVQLGGLKIAESGRLEKTERTSLLGQFDGKPGPQGHFERMLRWHFSDLDARTISPLSATTLQRYIEDELAWASSMKPHGKLNALRDIVLRTYLLEPQNRSASELLLRIEDELDQARDDFRLTPTAATSAPAAPPAAADR